jgi:hypothetical protein
MLGSYYDIDEVAGAFGEIGWNPLSAAKKVTTSAAKKVAKVAVKAAKNPVVGAVLLPVGATQLAIKAAPKALKALKAVGKGASALGKGAASIFSSGGGGGGGEVEQAAGALLATEDGSLVPAGGPGDGKIFGLPKMAVFVGGGALLLGAGWLLFLRKKR